VIMVSPCRLNTEVESPIAPCTPISNGKRDIYTLFPSASRMSFVSWGRLTRTKLFVSSFSYS